MPKKKGKKKKKNHLTKLKKKKKKKKGAPSPSNISTSPATRQKKEGEKGDLPMPTKKGGKKNKNTKGGKKGRKTTTTNNCKQKEKINYYAHPLLSRRGGKGEKGVATFFPRKMRSPSPTISAAGTGKKKGGKRGAFSFYMLKGKGGKKKRNCHSPYYNSANDGKGKKREKGGGRASDFV